MPHGESHASTVGSYHGSAYGDSEGTLPEVTEAGGKTETPSLRSPFLPEASPTSRARQGPGAKGTLSPEVL